MNMKKKMILREAAAVLLGLALLLNTGCSTPGKDTIGNLPDGTAAAQETEAQDYSQHTEADNGNGDYQTAQAATAEAGTTQSQNTGDQALYADAAQYPYYAQLSDDEKAVYRQIVDQVGQGNPEITPDASITGDELNAVVSAVYREQPQLFWMENEWNWYSYEITGVVTSITITFNELADNLSANIAAFQAAGEAALQNLEGLSDAEKELAIHDYLAANTTYASNTLDQNAYSALVNHSSVCCGFTRALQYLLQCEGIPAYFCQGTADGFSGSAYGSDHAWCIVKLGDGCYNVDVTWDETAMSDQGLIIYSYFNRTDEVFAADHQRDASSEFLPACTATEFSYEALRGIPAELGVTSQLNLNSSDPITSLDAYYQIMKDQIISTGTGTHTFSYIIYGDDCMNQIAEAVSTNAIQAGFMDDAVAAIGLNGYSSTLSYQETDLGGGYHYVSQTIELNAN